jgi:hypothetical protein
MPATRPSRYAVRVVLAAVLGAAAVAAPGGGGPVALGGLSEAHEVVAGAAATSPVTTSTARLGRHYAFSQVLDGKPVRWDPCTPIRWVSNARRGPKDGLTVLKAAVARIAATTGTTWVYQGDVATAPTTAYLPRSARKDYPPVLVGWTDAASSDLLRGKPRAVLGVTRTAWYGVRKDGVSTAATRAAVVALDRTDALPLRGPVSWSSVALHELAHAFGLDHPSDPAQLMSATLPRNVAGLQPGDVAGLQRLGRAGGCVRVPGA